VNSQTTDQIEGLLCKVYEQQAEKYEQAFAISEGLAVSFEHRRNADDALCMLRSVLDEVADLDRQVHSARQQWDSLKRRPGPRLRQVAQRLEAALAKLIPVISSAETSAREARDGLMPQMSRESRGHQMREAYASAVAGSSEGTRD